MPESIPPPNPEETSPQVPDTPPPAAGDEVLGFRLLSRQSADALREIWVGEANGEKRAVHILASSADADAAKRFRSTGVGLLKLTTSAPIDGMVKVHAVQPDGRAFVADLLTVGNVADLLALGWGIDKRIELVKRVCTSLQALHDHGFAHRCLLPTNVLLDDDFAPVLSDIGLHSPASLAETPTTKAFVAPELLAGQSPRATSDVFSVGKLLHFLLLDADPPVEVLDLPRLDALAADAPAGLVRIVRKCLVSPVEQRYASVSDLSADLDRYTNWESVGLAHPDVRDLNVTGAPFVPGGKKQATEPAVAAPKKPTAAKPTAPKPDAGEPFSPTAKKPYPTALRIASLSGLIITAGSLMGGFEMGNPAIVWRIGAALGLGLFAALVGLFGAAPKTQIIGGLTVFATFFAANVSSFASEAGLERRLASTDVAMVGAAVREMRAGGRSNFPNVRLTGFDLSGMNMQDVNLQWANLERANLTGANLTRTNLLGTKLSGTNFSGANMTEAKVQLTDFKAAICNEQTKLPDPWKCVAGHPAQ